MLLTVERAAAPAAMPAIGPKPAIGAASAALAAAPSGDAAAASSISDSQYGSSLTLATGVAEAHVWGVDNPPIGAAWPTLASTGPPIDNGFSPPEERT